MDAIRGVTFESYAQEYVRSVGRCDNDCVGESKQRTVSRFFKGSKETSFQPGTLIKDR